MEKDCLSKYDRINSLYSKYDLDPGLNNHRYSRHNDFLFGSGRDYRHTSRSWHPSPYVSDISDDEFDNELSMEEKAAKVREEIKRRRERLADSGRLYRHYSFDDYNILGDYSTDHLDPLATNPITDSSYNRMDNYRKYKYRSNEYPLLTSKERYYSDE